MSKKLRGQAHPLAACQRQDGADTGAGGGKRAGAGDRGVKAVLARHEGHASGRIRYEH